jgi:prephenate dehydrogenase
LIGGSIGLALQERSPETEVRVWARRDEAVAEISASGFASVVSTALADVIRGAKLVVFCTPIEVMGPLALQIAPLLDSDALITDAGSVKGSVVEALHPIFGKRFIGAHPIAGSDRAGLQSARANLYHGATCVVTPVAESPRQAVDHVVEFWKFIGCSVIEMSPDEHDLRLAFTSHLPHVVASSLAAVVGRSAPDWAQFVGGGFRDSTRIAASNPDLWTGILLANAPDVTRSIAELQKLLQEFRVAVESGDETTLRRLFAEARTCRNRLNSEFDGI